MARNGVQLFYISNRSKDELAATIENLKTAGFPQTDAGHVVMKVESSDKEPRRRAVAEKPQIVMLLGDNPNDFDALFAKQSADKCCQLVAEQQQRFGTTFIILPNTIYGDWELALWNGQPVTPKEADVLKHNALRGF